MTIMPTLLKFLTKQSWVKYQASFEDGSKKIKIQEQSGKKPIRTVSISSESEPKSEASPLPEPPE